MPSCRIWRIDDYGDYRSRFVAGYLYSAAQRLNCCICNYQAHDYRGPDFYFHDFCNFFRKNFRDFHDYHDFWVFFRRAENSTHKKE